VKLQIAWIRQNREPNPDGSATLAISFWCEMKRPVQMATSVRRLLSKRPLWIAAVFIAVIVAGCSRGGQETASHTVAVREARFETWDDFMHHEAEPPGRPPRVVFIGIDGGTWAHVDELLERGELPNIARIKREGAWGTLRSLPSQVSPPAWTSMMTGYAPEHSGIYSFGRWDRRGKRFFTVHSDDTRVPSLWDAASYTGRRVAVINTPMTYPVRAVNGIMVSGLLTPVQVKESPNHRPVRHTTRSDFIVERIQSFSKVFGAAVEDSLNLYLFLFYDTEDDGKEDYDTTTLRVLALESGRPADEQGRYRFPMNRYSPWIQVRDEKKGKTCEAFCKVKCQQIAGSLDIQFSQRVFPVGAQFAYPKDLGAELNARFGLYLPTKFLDADVVPSVTEDTAGYARFLYAYDDWDYFGFVFTQTDNIHHIVGFDERTAQVYAIIDAFIGEVMQQLPRGATLIVASDHGSGKYTYGVDLNRFLASINLLEWQGESEIDYERTLVFHNMFFLYFNHELVTRQELIARGVDVPEGVDPADRLAAYIEEEGRRLQSPEYGRAFPLEFVRLSAEGYAGDPPAMRVRGTYGDYRVQDWNLKAPRKTVLYVLHGGERFWHRRDGLFMMWGEPVRRGHDAAERDIADIAPTILYLMGLPTAPDMDGVPIFDALEPGALARKTHFVVEEYALIPRDGVAADDDLEDLEKKLKSLGYIHQ
jgi:predicted AlkP superfamily phosphohydrolase/phosphomutase